MVARILEKSSGQLLKLSLAISKLFYVAFNSLANRMYDPAQKIDAYRIPVLARDAMFRASTYFRWADFYLHGSPSDPRINSLWVQ